MSFHIIGFTLGILLTVLGLAEFIPAFLDLSDGHPNGIIFFTNAMICLFFGLCLILMNRSLSMRLKVRDTFMITTLSWVFFAIFGGIPYMTTDIQKSFTDAFFETMSGFTTTGSTVFFGLDNMSRGILLWRSMTQWMGGVGIVAFAIICLPQLKSGGMLLFQTESSDKSEKVMPRSKDVIISLFVVYIILTLLCAFTYFVLGMTFFDAINHAMTTTSTAGFSTHDKSFGYYTNPALHWSGTFFMFASALPFILYVKLVYQGTFSFFKDDQFKNFSVLLIFVIGFMSVWLWQKSDYSLFMSTTYVAFNIVSAITTTGYATTDYILWGPFASLMFLFVTYLGACAGSTAGGLKTMRWVIIYRSLLWQFKKILYPNGSFSITYNKRPVDDEQVLNIFCFAGLYVLANILITLGITATGVDFETALSGTATAMANSGCGTGAIIGPSGNFSSLPDAAKWQLSLAMLLGRLEILTVLVLFTKEYWKR